nr:immunoglobulin light chain junction region [Macaca mulatta]
DYYCRVWDSSSYHGLF